jgi:hypothetical protein
MDSRCSTRPNPTKDPEFLDDEPHEPMSIQTRMAAERATLGKNGMAPAISHISPYQHRQNSPWSHEFDG